MTPKREVEPDVTPKAATEQHKKESEPVFKDLEVAEKSALA